VRWTEVLGVLLLVCHGEAVGPIAVPLAHAAAAVLAGYHSTAMAGYHVAGLAHAVGAAHVAGAAHLGGAVHAAGATHTAGAATVVGIADQLLSGAVVTGAATSAAAGPKAVTDHLTRSSQPPSSQAVGRILQVEWDRLIQVAWHQGSRQPWHVLMRAKERLTERRPIIVWAVDLWLKEGLECIPFYHQVEVPNIWASLRALELELASQIKFGLTTSPLRVLRLAYSTLMVVLYALLGNVPGFKRCAAWCGKRLAVRWPKLVDHLAATLETNLATDPSRIIVSHRARRLGAKWRAWFPLQPSVQ